MKRNYAAIPFCAVVLFTACSDSSEGDNSGTSDSGAVPSDAAAADASTQADSATSSVDDASADSASVVEGGTDASSDATADSGAVVYPKSCAAIKTATPTAKDGLFKIDPDGAGPFAPLTVYCDMTTDGGGYTIYAVANAIETSRYDQRNSCTEVGLQLAVPRTKAHLEAMFARYGASFFHTVPGVYGIAAGDYTNCAMNSSDATCGANWKSIDGGPWFARAVNYGEPNGDYTPGGWLGSESKDENGLTFNDTVQGYSTGTSYLCSDNAKICATAADCNGPNVTNISCVGAGLCAGTCSAGFADCDNRFGCESSPATDIQNCGACGNVCPGSAPTCTAGVCGSPQLYASCKQILAAKPGAPSGNYRIDPDDAGPLPSINVYCDMTTDGGGYTEYEVINGVSSFRYTDPNSCTAVGLKLAIPRTKAHALAMIAKFGASRFQIVPGVYGIAAGDYTTCAMNSSDATCAANWKAIDGGSWFARDSSYGEPNGDYTPGCWLGAGDADSNGFYFNDANCQYETGPSYICSDNAK